ncbi:hypothetical protein D3C85_1523570 [compost metagenome]
MQSGRATNCTTQSSTSTMGPSCQSCARSRRAASRMNREEMRMTARSSLKASTSSRSSPSWLASQMPNTVTASRPDSWLSQSDRVKVTSTSASTPNLCRLTGNQSLRMIRVVIQPAATPMREPTPTVLARASRV